MARVCLDVELQGGDERQCEGEEEFEREEQHCGPVLLSLEGKLSDSAKVPGLKYSCRFVLP